MTITDVLYYVSVGNPVSKAVIGTTASMFSRGSKTNNIPITATANAAVNAMPPLWQLAGRNRNFVRLAGVSGATAVILGAIGSHFISADHDKGETKKIFENANRFHFFHSLALMGVPLAKYPALTGSLMIAGTLLFSGALYYRSLTLDKSYSHLAPYGGCCLILAWLTLMC